MKMRIWHKLALVLVITTAFVISVSFVIAQINFRHDFSGYLKEQEQRYIDSLSEQLVEAYETNQGWAFLQNNPRAWYRFLKGHFRNFTPPDNHLKGVINKPDHPKLYSDDRKPPPNEFKRDHNHYKSGPKGPPRSRHALLDKNKNMIVGRLAESVETQDYSINLNDQTIGYIRVKSVSGFTDKLDQRFVSSQLRAYVLIAFCALLFSLLAAWLLARYFRHRISQLTHIANALTAGDFEQRVTVQHSDELAELGTNFNVLAETLEKNRHAQKGWIADISHELRTPLSILTGEIEALQDGIRPLDKKALSSLSSETAHLNRLVTDLYQLAVSDVGKLDYQKTELDLNQLIRNVIANYESRFSEENISVTLELDEKKTISVFADEQRLTQLLINLFDNSIKYTDVGGQLYIQTRSNSDQTHLTVEDSSPGIPEESYPYIFDRLYRIESSRNRELGGAGLGLAIVHKIVEAHQGNINASASKLGGLKIEITLPRGYAG